MNFLEALKANETRKVRINKPEYDYYKVGELQRDIKNLTLDEIHGQWEAEPEVYVFEATWNDHKGIIRPEFEKDLGGNVGYNFANWIGKRTKITVEVLP